MKTKNKIQCFRGLLIIVLAVAISGCKDFKYDTYSVTDKPYVDQTSVELFLGTDAELASIQLTSSPSNRQFTWTSQNTAIATVTQTGLVTAKNEGYTNIIVTSQNDQFQVKVHVQQWIPVEKIILDVEYVEKYWYGMIDRFKINALYEPANATEKTLIEWTTSNTKIASVTNEGWVTYTDAGNVTVYAKAKGVEDSVRLLIKVPPVYKVTDPEFLDRSKWSFPGFRENTDAQIGYSSQTWGDGSDGVFNGVTYKGGSVYCMLDGEPNTFYHARWSSPATDYPHWFIIDLGEQTQLGGFMIQNRQGDSRSGTGLQFYTTDIEVNNINDLAEAAIWTSIGRYTYNTGNAAQSFAILPPYPTARYIKAYFGPEYKNGDYPYVMIGEFGLYRPKEDVVEDTPEPEPPFRKDWLYVVEVLPGNSLTWWHPIGTEFLRWFKFIDEKTVATCCSNWGPACDGPDWDLEDNDGNYTYFLRLKDTPPVNGVYELDIYYKDMNFFNNKSTYNSNTNEFYLEFEMDPDWDGDPGHKIVERAKDRRAK